MPQVVDCPVCGKKVAWNADSPFRPFCSERCKTIDLGDWAAERHVIAGNPNDVTVEGAPDASESSATPRRH